MNAKIQTLMIAAAALIVAIGAVGPATAATPTADSPSSPITNVANVQENETSQQCTPDSEPSLQQADLHTADETIEQGSPGRMSGAIVLDATAECPVKVQITLNVPNNMYIEGTSDIGSGGGGLITNTFVVEPGEAKDLAATVYGNDPGQRSVVADITYFPVDHKDMAQEIDGLTMTFDIQEAVQPNNASAGNADTGSGSGVFGNLPTTKQWLLGIVSITVIGLLLVVGRYAAGKVELSIKK